MSLESLEEVTSQNTIDLSVALKCLREDHHSYKPIVLIPYDQRVGFATLECPNCRLVYIPKEDPRT